MTLFAWPMAPYLCSVRRMGFGYSGRTCTSTLATICPGYEQPNEASNEAIRILARKEGLVVDPVYTGKGLAGMLDYLHTGKIPKGSTAVFLHTGGAAALFAEKELLGDLLKA